jgi:hypothetical protein
VKLTYHNLCAKKVVVLPSVLVVVPLSVLVVVLQEMVVEVVLPHLEQLKHCRTGRFRTVRGS